MYDVIIIGAGVIGAVTAAALSEYKLKICIVEREGDVAMGATKANSAIVHAGFDAKAGSLKAKLNAEGSEMMEPLCKRLGVSYCRNGSLVIGFNEEDKQKLLELLENGRKNGIRGLELVEGDALRVLEPGLSDEAVCALHAPTGAIVCPYELTEAAVGNAMDNGAKLKLHFEVASIEENDGVYQIHSAAGETLCSGIVVNAAGVYSDQIAQMIGDDSFAVHPRRGEYMLLDKECGGAAAHTIFTVPTKMGKGILVSPTVDRNLLLGPTSVDAEDKEDKTTTPDGLKHIAQSVNKMVKGVDMRMVITSFCGLRAVGDTGDFIINMPKKGFVNAAGIESPGLSASPAIAKYIVKLLKDNGFRLEKRPDYIKERQAVKRFRDWTDEQKQEMIQKDPAFGNIICRCEGITEGEIRNALRTNPKPHDLDGVKRRTRAQMGRCQGGFCSPQIVKIIAEELGISPEQVTKSGGGSYIIEGRTKEEGGNA